MTEIFLIQNLRSNGGYILYGNNIVLVLTVLMLKKIDLVTVSVYGDWGVHYVKLY
jgi:hypothetical protein